MAKRFISTFLMIIVIFSIISSVSIPVLAADKYGCTWGTKYQYVTDNGSSYGTNTFIIYGGKTVEINNASFHGNLTCVKKFLNSVDFRVKIYKGNSLKKTYTVGFGEDFKIPSGAWTKYTVKITPIINKSAYYKVGAYKLGSYYKYSLNQVK